MKGVPVAVQMVGTRNVGQVTCEVDNHDLKLLPNVNVNVTIVTGEHSNVLTLPREAVHQDGGKPYVFQIVDGVLRRQEVSVGISNLTIAEVSGLPENAQVALGALNGQPGRRSKIVVVKIGAVVVLVVQHGLAGRKVLAGLQERRVRLAGGRLPDRARRRLAPRRADHRRRSAGDLGDRGSARCDGGDAALLAGLDAPPPPVAPVDRSRVGRVAKLFDEEWRLTRWPRVPIR